MSLIPAIILPIITIFVTWYVPRKIMVEQQFMSLTEQYRSPEMGFAVHCIFDFYENDCLHDSCKIKAAYKKRFDDEIGDCMKNEWRCRVEPSRTLHFQRRMVAYFFWDLARLCFEQKTYPYSHLGNKKIEQMVGENEIRLIGVILDMNEASKERFVMKSLDEEEAMNEELKSLCEKAKGLLEQRKRTKNTGT